MTIRCGGTIGLSFLKKRYTIHTATVKIEQFFSRDLLGLQTILVYYPGHLACAVCFTDKVAGDYILLDGKRFVITDPTYIGAPVGKTMPDMDNTQASVILLN